MPHMDNRQAALYIFCMFLMFLFIHFLPVEPFSFFFSLRVGWGDCLCHYSTPTKTFETVLITKLEWTKKPSWFALMLNIL